MHSLHSDDEQQICAHDFYVNAPRSLQSLFYGITIHSAKEFVYHFTLSKSRILDLYCTPAEYILHWLTLTVIY